MSSTPQTTFEVSLLLYSYLEKLLPKKANLLVLDIASGFGKNGSTLKLICAELGGDCSVIGTDIWLPYLKRCATGCFDGLALCDAASPPFQPVFDIIFATEVLEHMEKQRAVAFLKKTELLLRNGGIFIVSTPQGLQPQEDVGGNPWQRHKSVWNFRELENLGFHVIASPQVLNTPAGKVFIPLRTVDKPGRDRLRNFLLYAFAPFAVLFPSSSGKLIAYKLKTPKQS